MNAAPIPILLFQRLKHSVMWSLGVLIELCAQLLDKRRSATQVDATWKYMSYFKLDPVGAQL